MVITGGIAAYKSLELIRLMKKAGASVRCILTEGGKQFVTPLSVSALCEEQVYDDLWSLKDESEMGHIRLSREADLIVVAPCTANFIAKMAHGLTDDLASTTLLASNAPIMIAPAMNVKMWENDATQENLQHLEKLSERGIMILSPVEGAMACGEYGVGRMEEPESIFKAIEKFFAPKALVGKKALVTAGPTYEPIDPVRFIGNRSSGKQGYAIAQALADEGAEVTLVSGPCHEQPPTGVNLVRVETAEQMLKACESALPCDIGVFTAAVSDWAVDTATQKIKKGDGAPTLKFQENPDILKTISNHQNRPSLVIGFAAETENLIDNAKSKLASKNCDWIVANDVSDNVFGSNENHVYLLSQFKNEEWPRMSKKDVAVKLVQQITEYFEDAN